MTVANTRVTQVLLKRGNVVRSGSFVGALSELTHDTTLNTVRIHNGQTPGGHILATNAQVWSLSNAISTISGLDATFIANIGNLLANASAQQTTINSISGNIGSFYSWANTNFGTSSYSNANVAAYLTTNPQGGQYSNANVASYLTTSNIITGIDANVTAANLQITNLWSNAGVQADAIAGANTAIITANTALKGYVDTQLSTLTNGASTALDTLLEIGTALGNNANFSATMITWLGNVTANTTAANNAINILQANIGSYYTWANANVSGLYSSIIAANTAWQANAASQAEDITTLYANAEAQANSLLGANAAIITANTAMKSYVDAVTTAWTANAGTQQSTLNTVQANIGSFYTYANLHFSDSSFGNSNVAAYLSASTTGNVGAGNLTVINNFSTNVISANSFTYANGTSILDGIGGTYSNVDVSAYLSNYDGGINFTASPAVITGLGNISSANFTFANGTSILDGISGTYSNSNVSAYLSSQNITTANIGGLYDSITAANATVQALSANVGGFYTWANTNFGTSSYGDANVAAYLLANPQGGNYSNVNVASYLSGQGIAAQIQTDYTQADTANIAYIKNKPDLSVYSTVANAAVQATWLANLEANAGSQATSISTINANIGAYQTFANANAATQATSISTLQTQVYSNANVIANLQNLTTNVTTTAVVTAGNVVSTGDVWTATGNLRTTNTTGNVFNFSATTVNIGGAATVAVNIGNAAGVVNLSGNVQGSTNGFAIGYRDIPQVSLSGSTTIALSDAGKHYYSTSASNFTLTVANNASAAFNVGAAINIINQGTGTITIAPGVGVAMYLAGNSTASSRTLSSYGMATVQKVATDTWFAVGVGLV